MHKWTLYNIDFIYKKLFDSTDILKKTQDYSNFRHSSMHFPAGTAWKNLIHLTMQMRGEGDILTKYNQGPERNHQIYGSKDAKTYEVSNIRDLKISAYIGTNDFLEPPSAAKKGFARLTNNQENIKLTIVEGAHHSSFHNGKDSKTIIDKIIKDCNEF